MADRARCGPGRQPLTTGSFSLDMTATANIRIALFLTGLLTISGTTSCSWNTETLRRVASLTNAGSSPGVEIRRRPKNPLEAPMSAWSALTGHGGLQPGERSELFLRRHALANDYARNPAAVLGELKTTVAGKPDLERLHVLAELAYIEGHRQRLAGNEQLAGQMLSTAVMASYQYLFDPRLDVRRNAYDPLFRQVCDTYNASLEGMLRIMKDQNLFRPGGMFVASSLDEQPLEIAISNNGRWRDHEFERFEFVSDFDTEGLKNIYHTYGLGVPVIGIRKSSPAAAEEKYYPRDLAVPLTAFVHTSIQATGAEAAETRHKCLIQLIDPLEQTDIAVGDRFAPLESDITTPLAYYLDDPLLGSSVFATVALLNGEFAGRFRGIYMLEPYDPEKIPVVMVHGFWSSPMTWTEMFNDLRGDKAIRDNYQFWFYMYPSGQPFWFSARQMREDLAELRQLVDPDSQSAMLDEMVLVGHSMGGLVSRLQTLDSEERFWQLVSDKPVALLRGNFDTRNRLRDTLFFEANPSIARVVTIGTPHRGSPVSNNVTRWFSQQLFRLPDVLSNEYSQLARDNPGYFAESSLLSITTSTDALSPESRFFDVMQQARRSQRVTYHNIVGRKPGRSFWPWESVESESDGVVSLDSARTPDASSEVEVPAEHSLIHRHPLAILEVRKVLLLHLAEARDLDPAEITAMQESEPRGTLLR